MSANKSISGWSAIPRPYGLGAVLVLISLVSVSLVKAATCTTSRAVDIQFFKRAGALMRMVDLLKVWSCRATVIKVGLCSLLGLLLLGMNVAAVAATATASPTTCTGVTGPGTQAWSNASTAILSDNNDASATLNANGTQYLRCTNYGFSIPITATISGITVSVERSVNRTDRGNVVDLAMRLVKAGTIQATDRSTTTAYTTTDTYEAHGGTSDLWGTTWTPAEINSTNFGAAFAATKAATQNVTVNVDHIRISVEYTLPPAPTVTAISPNTGSTAGGTSVTITGTNFTGATGVTIGGAAATSVVVVSATSITAVTPARTAGAKDVVVTTPSGSGTGTGLFTYVAPPTVTTNAATALTATGATLNGTVSSNGAATTVTFEYGPTTSYGTTVTATQSPLAGSASNAAVSYTLTGLSCSTTYHFRVKGDNGSGITNGSDATFTTSFTASLCPTVAIYTLDDQTWNDSSGNGYNGAIGGLGGTAPIFSSVSPAVGTTTGTCGYRSFTRSEKTYIYLPSSFPNMGADGNPFTITAWIRTTDNTQSGQRILIDDESNSGGYGFSLGDNGTGMVRFFTRGAASALILDTPNVVANNTWYFVAAVADVPNKRKHIYVFNTAGSLLSHVTSTWTEASFGSDSGVASMGGETNASGENTGSFGFAGNLDEVRVYSNVLSQTDLATVQAITRACPGNVVTPGAFNACEVTSPKCTPTALPDVSYAALTNKTAGQSFDLDAVALLSGGTLKSSFAGNVQVDLLANTASGVTIGSDNCPVSQTATIALGNKTFASGRASLNAITINSVYSDVRVRYTCTAAVCGTAVTACSTGSFAVVAAGPDHYELSLPSSSVSCLASTATVTACANNSSPCTSTFPGANGSTATLVTTGATLGATTVTFNAAGVATTTLSYPTATDGTTVSVTLSGETLTATNARQCCPDGVGCAANNSCSTTFKTSGLIFSTLAGGAAATIPTQTAGTTSSQYYLRAVKTSTTTQACESALSGTSSVNLGYQCNNPSTCSTGDFLDITPYNGAAAQATQTVAAGGTALDLYFDTNGNAPLTFNYRDVGQITLAASKAASGSLLSALAGTSNAFVVKPGGFLVAGIQQTAIPQLVNPAAADQNGAVFVRAGESFTASVTATTSAGATTPNYGQETVPEGVLLTRNLVLPGGGAAGTLANATIAGGSFTNGVATVTDLAWDEVGIITLTPGVADGDYLGSGIVTGTTSANIGRFIPDRFDTVITQGCAAGGYTYSGQPFALTVTARNLAGVTTQNYHGAGASPFARAHILTDANALATPLGGFGATNTVAANSFVQGIANVATPTYTYANANRQVGPSVVKIHTVDADAVTSAAVEGNTNIRGGRARLLNAYGSERLDLPMPLTVEFWNGLGWVRNINDSCTTGVTLARADPVPADALAPANVSAWDTGNPGVSGIGTPGAAALRFNAVANAGNFNLNLRAPGVGLTGTMDITATVPAWLQFDWTGGGNADPVGRATFGVFRSPLIYRRENY